MSVTILQSGDEVFCLLGGGSGVRLVVQKASTDRCDMWSNRKKVAVANQTAEQINSGVNEKPQNAARPTPF